MLCRLTTKIEACSKEMHKAERENLRQGGIASAKDSQQAKSNSMRQAGDRAAERAKKKRQAVNGGPFLDWRDDINAAETMTINRRK